MRTRKRLQPFASSQYHDRSHGDQVYRFYDQEAAAHGEQAVINEFIGPDLVAMVKWLRDNKGHRYAYEVMQQTADAIARKVVEAA
jgi:hypothetical protein